MKMVWSPGFSGMGAPVVLVVPRPHFENRCLKPVLCTLAARGIQFPADLLSLPTRHAVTSPGLPASSPGPPGHTPPLSP